LAHLKSLSPAAVDFELRSIDLSYNQMADLKSLLAALLLGLRGNKDFELYQSYLSVTMRIHGDIICSNMLDFQSALDQLRINQQASWLKLDSLFQQSLSIIDFIRGM
jgi:U3 small nucleolar RNA-associated protein 21